MILTNGSEPRQGQEISSTRTSAKRSIELLGKLGNMFDYSFYSPCQEGIGAIERLLNRGLTQKAAATGFELVRQRRQDALPNYLGAIEAEIDELDDARDFKAQLIDVQLEMGLGGERGFDSSFRSLMNLRSRVYEARKAQAYRPGYGSQKGLPDTRFTRALRSAERRAKTAC